MRRWRRLEPIRQRALVRASVLFLGAILSVVGTLVSQLSVLVAIGAVATLLAAHSDIPSIGGILPYHETSNKLKVCYWLSWLVLWPVYLAIIAFQGWMRVIHEWQSAPALVSARIAELEKELAEPTKE